MFNSYTEKIFIERNKQIESAILCEIRNIAKENGIYETHIILNEATILHALKKHIPRKPTALENVYPYGQYECPICGCGLIANKRWKSKYCPNCGQAIDWSEKGGD